MLQIHFCCFYLSLILGPFGPTDPPNQKKKKTKELGEATKVFFSSSGSS